MDGPYGTPSSRIFQASHAVLIAAGIGVTPFASILQSIMYRHYANQQNGSKKYTMNLKKVTSSTLENGFIKSAIQT